MTWWLVVLLCWLFYQLGHINATVAERERYWAWMSNSWVMLKQRTWWMEMLSKGGDKEDATIQDVVEVNQNMFRTIHDFHAVFGRPYKKEAWLPSEPALGESLEASDGSE